MWTGSGSGGCHPWWSFWPSCDIGCCRCPGGQVVCPRDALCRPHHLLESLAVEGGAVAVLGGDTARQDALNCASVKVCEGFRWQAKFLQPRVYCYTAQSLDNKADEIRARIAFQRDISDCNILYFTETWLSRDMLSESVQPSGFSMHGTNRDKLLSGKRKGGGVCFMSNDSWCNHNNIQKLKSICSSNLELRTIKCWPFYLPREFSSVIVTAVYIPPPADTNMTIKKLHWTICKLETT